MRWGEPCAPMPEHRGQNIAQRNTNNENTNGKMQFHVRHYPALLGLFGIDDAQYGQDRTRLIETNQAFSKGVSVSTRFACPITNDATPKQIAAVKLIDSK